MLKDKKFTGNHIGRDSKYNFKCLEVDSCLMINIPYSETPNPKRYRHKVSTALYQWKKYNHLNWVTAVRLEGDYVCVYRIK